MKKTISISGIPTGEFRSGNRFMTFVMFGVPPAYHVHSFAIPSFRCYPWLPCWLLVQR